MSSVASVVQWPNCASMVVVAVDEEGGEGRGDHCNIRYLVQKKKRAENAHEKREGSFLLIPPQ